MYNNFSSKKTKKVISALLATALVATSAPISADAATAKVVGVGKTITYNAKAKVKKVTVKNKKIVTAKKSGKKVTIKGKKAGKTTVTIKTTKKTIKLTVKVGATAIAKKSVTTSMKVGETKALKVTATNGKGDTIKFTSNNKAAVKVNKASAVANSKKVAGTTVTALKAGTAKITATSKNTGKKKAFTITVVGDTTPQATTGAGVVTTPSVTATVNPSTNPGTNPGSNATNAPQATTGAGATATPGVTTTPGVSGDVTTNPDATQNPNATVNPDATANPDATQNPTATATPSTGSAVVSLSAVQTGRQTIKITGSNLSDTATDYVVKRGASAVSVAKVAVSEDKTTATLTSASSALAAGTYTIAFGGQTVTVEVNTEVVQEVVIVGTQLVASNTYGEYLDAEGNVVSKETEGAIQDLGTTIGYKILNQFGERMSGDVTPTCMLGAATIATPASKTADGVIKVELTSAATLGTTSGTLVLVETNSGKSATATVTVSSKAVINSVDVLGIYDVTGEEPVAVTNLETGADAGEYAILLSAKDQYGNPFKTFNGANGGNVTITVAGNTELTIDAAAWTDTKTIDGEDYIVVPFAEAKLATEGNAVITIVGNSVGLLASVTVPVKKAVAIADFQISPVDTLYVGTKTEVDYTVTDTEGNTVTDYAKLKDLKVVSNEDFKWERQNDGSAKLYVTPTVAETGATLTTTPTGTNSKTAVLTTTVGTNVHTLTVSVYAQKTCSAVVGVDDTVALASVIGGNTLSFTMEDLKIQDQYGNIMTDDEVKNDVATVYLKVEKEANGKGFADYETTYTQIGNGLDLSTLVFTTTTAVEEEGSSVYTLSLTKANNSDKANQIVNSDTQITLKSTNINKVKDFTLETLPTLYICEGEVDNDATQDFDESTLNGASTNVELKVTGKYGALTVSIPKTMYKVINTDHIEYDAETGKISATGNTIEKDDKKSSVVETLELVMNNDEGTSVKQDVTVSSIAPEVAKVSLKENEEFVTGSLTGDDSINYATFSGKLSIEDQYEGYAKSGEDAIFDGSAATPRVMFSNIPEKFKVANNNTEDATLTMTDASVGVYTVGVTLTYSTGVTFSDTLVVFLDAAGTQGGGIEETRTVSSYSTSDDSDVPVGATSNAIKDTTSSEDALALLPETAYAKLSDGSYVQVSLSWDWSDGVTYDNTTSGNYEATATVTGLPSGITPIDLTADVTVSEEETRTVSSYSTSNDSDVSVGATSNAIKDTTSSEDALALLPETAYAKLSDGSYVQVSLSWDWSDGVTYDNTTSGNYEATATVTGLPSGITPIDLTANVTVSE